MTRIILFLWLALPILTFGQKTKTVTKKYENPNYKEVYRVLKSDKSIKHGKYQKFWGKNSLDINGFYKNGLKDSIWTEYYSYPKSSKIVGNYLLDQKVGVWEFYNRKGEVIQKYNYSTKELVYYEPSEKLSKQEYTVFNDNDTIKTELERIPLYIGGNIFMFENIVQRVNFPEEAMENGISGEVKIVFTIDSNGKTSNHRVAKGIGYGCDEEALRFVKSLPDNWIPGILNGKLVSVEHAIKITFKVD
jgi:protein TonB